MMNTPSVKLDGSRNPPCRVVLLLTAAEGKLNRIVIKCPNTGKLVYTGFAMDMDTFSALPIEEMDPLECPACHKIHRWQKKDALFEREDPRAAS